MPSRATRVVRISLCGVALVFGGCFPYPVQETPHVRGVVIDGVSQRPVAGASVHFERYQEKSVVTGSEGRFDIPSISRVEMMPMAPYDRSDAERWLLVEAPGYAPLRMKFSIWRGGLDEKVVLKR